MSDINSNAAAARESARQSNGKFGAQENSESGDVDLTGPPPPVDPKLMRHLARTGDEMDHLQQRIRACALVAELDAEHPLEGVRYVAVDVEHPHDTFPPTDGGAPMVTGSLWAFDEGATDGQVRHLGEYPIGNTFDDAEGTLGDFAARYDAIPDGVANWEHTQYILDLDAVRAHDIGKDIRGTQERVLLSHLDVMGEDVISFVATRSMLEEQVDYELPDDDLAEFTQADRARVADELLTSTYARRQMTENAYDSMQVLVEEKARRVLRERPED